MRSYNRPAKITYTIPYYILYYQLMPMHFLRKCWTDMILEKFLAKNSMILIKS